MREKKINEILHVLPVRLRPLIEKELLGDGQIQEIRLRCGKPVHILTGGCERSLPASGILTSKDMQETMEFVSRFSMYAYEEEIRQGFLTIKGGHRVGIAGKAVLSHGSLKTIRNISFIHIRIACEYRDCARGLLPYLYENGILQSTLIFSAPGQGKTTLMRDLIRLISGGNSFGKPKSVSVVDERGELAACDQGIPQNDLGEQTDVMDGCPKSLGMQLMLRSMAPSVLAVDEIGGEEDVEAIFQAAGCGCIMLATAHGENLESIFRKEAFYKLRQAEIFDRYIQLDNGQRPGKWQYIFNGEGERIV
ncbi:MAG: stage III sporulation protein AA [Lachnospiraceae bacterium]|nr:stage III sporulation protein AA [Lachnospiraceae bacterium]